MEEEQELVGLRDAAWRQWVRSQCARAQAEAAETQAAAAAALERATDAWQRAAEALADTERARRELEAIRRQLGRVSPPPPGRAKVVVADDHEDLLAAMATTFRCHPRFFVAAEARDGAEAVGYTLVEQPELVVLDWNMPVLDGPGAAAAIRRYCPRTRLLLISAADWDSDEGLVDAFLPKPFTPPALLATAERLLSLPS